MKKLITTILSWGSKTNFNNPLDVAIGIHAGVRLTKLQISAFFDKGLMNISDDSKNQVLGVSLGYIF